MRPGVNLPTRPERASRAGWHREMTVA